MKENQVLIIADWSMKYLPQPVLETQTEWYGKQGISWHITCVLFPEANIKEKMMTVRKHMISGHLCI